jgi:MYND finger
MSFNPFLVVIKDKIINPWNIHRVNLARLPILDTTRAKKLQWLNTHLGITMSDRERALRDADVQTEVLLNLKDSLHTIFVSTSGIQGRRERVFSLVDSHTNNSDTLIFITDLRLDVSCHTVIADGYVLPMTHDIMPSISQTLGNVIKSGILNVKLYGEELRAWKRILPAFAERCREWGHTDNCEYLLKGSVPLSEAIEENPLCGCGKGKDVEALLKVKEWRKFAPYVTKIALGPLFSVSYLDSVGGDLRSAANELSPQPSSFSEGVAVNSGTSGDIRDRCMRCGGRGKPKLLVCGKCRKVSYCSEACQKVDWKTHKPRCSSV